MGQWSKWTNVLKWSIKHLNCSYYCPHFDNSPHLTHMKTFLVVVHNLQKPIGGPASDTRLTVYIWQPFEARL